MSFLRPFLYRVNSLVILAISTMVMVAVVYLLRNQLNPTQLAALGVAAAALAVTVIVRYLDRDLPHYDKDASARYRYLEEQSVRAFLTDHDRAGLVTNLREELQRVAKEDFLNDIRSSIVKDTARLELEDKHTETTTRLRSGMTSLSRRASVNLALGIVTASTGIAVLGYNIPLFAPDNFVSVFTPRISLVIIIETFAYFFLRLYSKGLIEIKYFQNEITNVESKYMALLAAMHLGKETTTSDVIGRLAQTERNYVLQRGQTTAEVELAKLEEHAIASLAQAILKALDRKP